MQRDLYRARNVTSGLFVGLVLAAAIGCAHLAHGASVNREATLSCGGGLAGFSETITLSSVDGVGHGRWKRSDRPEASTIRLSDADFARTLQDLDSMAGALPPSPPDTAARRQVCGDYILMRLEVRAGSTSHLAIEKCPHRSAELESYWRHLHEIFNSLVDAAK